MNADVEAYIRAETKLAEATLRKAQAALNTGATANFQQLLRDYVLHRFLLFDSEFRTENQIAVLSEESTAHTMRITGGDLKAADVITGCGSETTWIYKKTKLLFALQKAFSIKFDPVRAANILTVSELAEEILQLKAAKVEQGMETDCAITDADSVAVQKLRQEFPIFGRSDQLLLYLDNAATMQVPQPVKEAVSALYDSSYANVHRGIHTLSEKATQEYENAREIVARFLKVSAREVIFTSGTTAGLNMLAASLGAQIHPGDRIVVTQMEHHSNYLPWLELCKRTGAEFLAVPITADGELDMQALQAALERPTKIFAFTQCSNVLGTLNPVAEICKMAAAAGVMTVIDGAQGVRHCDVDMRELRCDFYVFSGHKLMAGTGIGVLYGKRTCLEALPPPGYGGGMIQSLHGDAARYEELPWRWEAGTPNIAGAVALTAALEYRERIGLDWIRQREEKLVAVIRKGLEGLDGVRLLGHPAKQAGCVSFSVDTMSAQDVAAGLDLSGIAVRAGHHCAIPLHRAFGLQSSVRVSPAFYNTMQEISQSIESLRSLLASSGPHGNMN